jgi:FMN phosphatase YigB (HAD superfamily)
MTLHADVLRTLDDVEVVSLDVFDTSVHRVVLDPVDVFALVAERVPAIGDGAAYRRLRRRAERDARRRSTHGEVGLLDIFDQVALMVGERALADELRDTELSLELELVRASEPGLELAEEAHRRGLRLAYLSDMYLPSSFIGALIAKAGLPEAPVFVSSEHGTTKASGGLFRVLRQWVGVDPQLCVHVGDDPGADHRGAREAGLRTIEVAKPSTLYRARWERFPVPKGLRVDDSLALGLGAPALSRTVPPLRADDRATRLDAIGEAVLGPTVLAFTSWIAERAGHGTAPLLFCSRDGMLPLECYQRFAADWSCSAPARYFHVSRRSVAVPALAGGLRAEHRELLCGGRRPRSVRQLFERVGLDAELAARAATLVGVGTIDEPLSAGVARDATFAIFQAVEREIAAHAQVELDAFARYWNASGLDDVPEVVLIDVGWRATVQRALQDCLSLTGQPTVVRGLYLALLDHGPLEPGSAEGMLIHDGRSWWRRATMEAGVPVVEMLFQADHGSVLRYGDAEPELGPASTGRHVVDPIQHGARRFLATVAELSRTVRPTIVATYPLLRLLTQPRPVEAMDLGGFEHSDGLADDANSAPILPSRLAWRDLRPTAAGRATLRSSEWRPGMVALVTSSPRTRRVASTALGGVKLAGQLLLRARATRVRRSPRADR